MSKYVLGLYEKSMPDSLSIRDKLRETKKGGYDFLELSIDETDKKLGRLNWSARERSEVIRAMEQTGIPIRSLCLSGHRKYPLGHPNPSIRSRSMEIMEKAIGLACDLGVRIIQLAGYDVYYEEGSVITRKLFAQNLRRAVEMAAKEGVILAFETMETDFMNTVTKAMRWVEVINSPYLQVYPDAGNITNAATVEGKDVRDDLQVGKGHIAALHLKESKPGVFRDVPYGEGHVDFLKIMVCAWNLGVRRYLAEFWYDGTENWRGIIQNNHVLLTNYIEAAAQNKHI